MRRKKKRISVPGGAGNFSCFGELGIGQRCVAPCADGGPQAVAWRMGAMGGPIPSRYGGYPK